MKDRTEVVLVHMKQANQMLADRAMEWALALCLNNNDDDVLREIDPTLLLALPQVVLFSPEEIMTVVWSLAGVPLGYVGNEAVREYVVLTEQGGLVTQQFFYDDREKDFTIPG